MYQDQTLQRRAEFARFMEQEQINREWQAADYITKCTIERQEWHRRRKIIFIAILCLPLYATMMMLGRAFADFMMR